jgi:hypothetical protein
MKKLLSCLLLFSSIAFGECTQAKPPLDKVYSPATVANDLRAIHDAGQLTTAQCQQLLGYIAVAPLSNVQQPLAGLTYRQLAKKAQEFKQQHAAPADSMETPPPFKLPAN